MTERSDPHETVREDREVDEETDGEPTGDREDAETEGDADDSNHLDDVEDGAGCTEIWEHLSESREAE